jgi:hypothetical protein
MDSPEVQTRHAWGEHHINVMLDLGGPVALSVDHLLKIKTRGDNTNTEAESKLLTYYLERLERERENKKYALFQPMVSRVDAYIEYRLRKWRSVYKFHRLIPRVS